MLILVMLGGAALALAYGGTVIRRLRNRPAVAAPAQQGADRDREREEARLATALLAGDLPLVWYRHRMTELAARDDACHPLVVPPTGELPGDSASA